MKLALAADWLPIYAGAEHVLREFTVLFPDAPIFTTVVNRANIGPLKDADIRTSRLQPWYRIVRNHRILLPWMPREIESMDLRGYDVILSSSHAVGKGIVPPRGARHICYCHTPMRYAWEMEQQYLEDFHVPKFLRRRAQDALKQIRRWDLTTAKRVDLFIANSRTTQERIRRIYNRDSIVIHPPVGDRFSQAEIRGRDSRNSFLAIGRLVPYKRFDLLIEAANAMRLPLKIAGAGSDETRLRKLAGPTVELLGFVPEERLPDLYAGASALLFPQCEDAGVVPLEAQACGTPVIAYGAGGALDTVRDGETGLFFPEQSVEALRDALERFGRMPFDPGVIRAHARKFRAEDFRKRIGEVVSDFAAR